MRLNVACIQLTSGSDIAANIVAIESYVKQAKAGGAEFIALPENAFYMRAEGEAPPQRYMQSEHPGVIAAKEWAKQHAVWLLVGSVAVIADDANEARLINRSLLMDADGNITATYDKIHLFDVEVGDGQVYRESERMAPGAKAVCAHTPWGYMGMTVCYDIRFPHLYRTLAKMGASMLLTPAAFTAVTGEAHWHVLNRARAIENGCFVISPGQCGTHPGGRKTYGHSLIIDPWGKVLADGGEAAGIISAVIDLDEVAKIRGKIPSLQHDREFK
jgi:predicted amidohydrolase